MDSLNIPWILIPGERTELLPDRPAEEMLQRSTGHRCKFADCSDPLFGKALTRDRPHPPDQIDRQRVEKVQFGGRFYNDHPIGLGHLRCDFGKVFGSGGPDGNRQPDFLTYAFADLSSDLAGLPEEV